MPDMYRLVENIRLPRMAEVRCEFDRSAVEDVPEAVRAELGRPEIDAMIRPGMRIAVGVGSRGLASLREMVKTLVGELKKRGALPFIVPSMGSHGGATAEGQTALLKSLGITEETAGCPIRATMETVPLGTVHVPELDVDLESFIDKNAYEADGIITIARVKPHPAFKDTIESGLCKMFVIGLGKQKGAQNCHTAANGRMGRVVEAVASANLPKCKVLFTLGTVENAYDRICLLKAVPRDEMIETDKAMLKVAKERIGRLPFQSLDVLIAKQMGKEISGEGLDPNITGRRAIGPLPGGPTIGKVGVLALSDESDGNVVGIGAVDAITEKLYKRIDLNISYANALTTGGLHNVKLPMILKSDFEVIAACDHANKLRDTSKARMVLIKDTLHLSKLYCSESLKEEIAADPRLTVLGEFKPLEFDENHDLVIDWG